jgi:hypothetical protein
MINPRRVFSMAIGIAALCLLSAPASQAQSVQLFSPASLGVDAVTTDYPQLEQAVLDNPYVLTTVDNVLTFTNNSPNVGNKWTRLDQFDSNTGEGLAFANFAPGTRLLLANSATQFTVAFDKGVKTVGFNANVAPFGPEEFQFEVFNGAKSLGTYTVSGVSSNDYTTNPAPFLGAGALGSDVITKLTMSVTNPRPEDLQIGFQISPVTYLTAPVPGPSALLTALLGMLPGAGLVLRRRRVQRG